MRLDARWLDDRDPYARTNVIRFGGLAARRLSALRAPPAVPVLCCRASHLGGRVVKRWCGLRADGASSQRQMASSSEAPGSTWWATVVIWPATTTTAKPLSWYES